MKFIEYFQNHPRYNAYAGVTGIEGVDDVLLYCGVPVDRVMFDMVREGRLEDEVPADSLRKCKEIYGV